MADSTSDSSKQKPLKRRAVRSNDGAERDDSLSHAEVKAILDQFTQEEHEPKDIKQSVVRKLTADLTERSRKLGAYLEAIHGYVVKDCTNMEESQDNCLSEELAEQLRKRTTSVDSEIKQLENQMSQLQRTLVKGKGRRESIRHRMSVSASSPGGGRKVSALSSCSSTLEGEEFSLEECKAKIDLLENEKMDLIEDKKDLGDEIKFLKYQLQYRTEMQSLQTERDNSGKTESHIKLENENKALRDDNAKLKERLSNVKKKLEENGHMEETLLSITDLPDLESSGPAEVLVESELDRLYTERKILLSTIMRMQSEEKDDEEAVSFADFGVQVDLNKSESTEEKDVTPLVAKLTTENNALKKHIIDMQNEIDEREKESKAMDEENYKLTDEKRTLEDTVNKLRTQINDTLDTTLDEIEQLHAFNEDLERKFKRTESKSKELSQTLNDLQNNNCKALESLLDEVENKVTTEEIFDVLDKRVTKLIEENCVSIRIAEQKTLQKEKVEKQNFSSNLLNEVKTCKELLESQRSHIRELQLDKRDIEEGYTKLKRELLLLKSSKQRARENSKELQFLRKRRAKSLNDGSLGGVETKSVLVDKESLQREVKRLGSVRSQLENTVQRLKKEKASLDDDKVCLLGSLYHQLERNESLEMQIEELTLALQQWEVKAELENEVFEEENSVIVKPEIEEEVDHNSNIKYSGDDTSARTPDKTEELLEPISTDNEASSSSKRALVCVAVDEYGTTNSQSPIELLSAEDAEKVRSASPVLSIVSSAAEESLQEMKQKIHALGEQLKHVQESVGELETERDKLHEDLDESKKNEKELRNVIMQLNRENGIQEDKLAKNTELVETLQIRLREAQEAKEESMENVHEVREENIVFKKHSEMLDNRLKEVTKQRDDLRGENEELEKKADEMEQNFKDIFELVDEISKVSSLDEATKSEKSLFDVEEKTEGNLGTILGKVSGMKKALKERCNEHILLNSQLESLNEEKEALHRSVREIDDKKKQMKGFITKLTDEKEQLAEQMDDMKQQKGNLADALESVYQSKEKLESRLSEALCKQDQYKNSLLESIDETRTLRESLYRVVNEHETMKESLLHANREIERLKSLHHVHHASTTLKVISEEDEVKLDKINSIQSEAGEHTNRTKDSIKGMEILKVLDKLAQSLDSLLEGNSKFETQIKVIVHCNEVDGEDQANKRSRTEISSGSEEKDNDLFPDEKSIENGAYDKTGVYEKILECIVEKLSKEEEVSEEIQSHIEQIKLLIQQEQIEDEDNESISGLVQLQQELLSKKLDSEQSEERQSKMLAAANELEAATKVNTEVVQDLEKSTEKIDQLQVALLAQDSRVEEEDDVFCKEKDTESLQKGEEENKHQNDEDSKENTEEKAQYLVERINKLERMIQETCDLLNAAKHDKERLQEENKLLNNKFEQLVEKRQNHDTIEMELENSINETETLEKQVHVLSKEGATLREEADERVQRLIELEEKMIITMEKKLELAEFASAFKSKKEDLQKKCEQLSCEVEALRKSRDQLLAGKSASDEQMQKELKDLKNYKEQAVKGIEELQQVIKVGKQDFEVLKIEFDSMQRKNKDLKQQLGKATGNGDAENARELQELQKKYEELQNLLRDLITVFQQEVKGGDTPVQGPENIQMATLKELEEWIKSITQEVKTYTNETKIVNAFVEELDVKISEILLAREEKLASEDGEDLERQRDTASTLKENYENARCKFELLIERLKESCQNETSLQTQLGKIEEDNERINKELAGKSSFLQTMRDSFEQLLEERNILARKAVADLRDDGSQQGSSESVLTEDSQSSTVCDNCKKLEEERDDLTSQLLSMNEASTELAEKCHDLKEQLLLLKQQQENKDMENERELDQGDGNETHLSTPDLKMVVQENLQSYECAPEFQSEPDEEEEGRETSDEKVSLEREKKIRSLQDELEQVTKQFNLIYADKEELESRLAELEGKKNEVENSEKDIQPPKHTDNLTEQLRLELSTFREKNQNLESSVRFMEEKTKETMHIHQRETTELKKDLQQLEGELVELKKENEETEALIINFKSEIERLRTQNGQKETQSIKGQTSADSDSEESVKLHKMLADRSNSLKDLNEKLGVSKNFMQKILDENTDFKQCVVNSEKENRQLTNNLEVLKVETDMKKMALIQERQEKLQLEGRKYRLEEELASHKEQLKSRGNLLATLEKDKESFKKNLRELQNEVTVLKARNTELIELSISGEGRREETDKLIKKLKQSCDDMTAKCEKANTEKNEIEEMSAEKLQNEKDKSEELRALLENLEKDYATTKTSLVESKEKVQTLNRELRRDRTKRDREMGSIKQENTELLADGERCDRQEVDILRKDLEDERNKIEKWDMTLEVDLQLESDKQDQTSEELEGNQQEGRRLSTPAGDLTTKIADLEALLKAVKAGKKSLEDELNRAKEENSDLRERLSEANEDKEELEEILSEMREKRHELYDEIDKALFERDDYEDELIETKREMSNILKVLSEENKILQDTLKEQDDSLKNDLEKRLELQIQSTPKEGEATIAQGQDEDVRKMKEEELKVKTLTCALKKSEEEIQNLRSELENKGGTKQKPNEVQESLFKMDEIVLQSCAAEVVDKADNLTDPRSAEEGISKYITENMTLRARLEESDSKLITLQEELYRIAKEGVQDELRADIIKRECQTLRDALRKSKDDGSKLKASLKTSNEVQIELRRHLRSAVADKEKFEREYKRLMLEKGSVEKVMVTSREMPAATQIQGLEGDFFARAESLESARKEIVILESQLNDLRTRSESTKQNVKRKLADIAVDLKRAMKHLGLHTEGEDKGMARLNATDTLEVESRKDCDELLMGIHQLHALVNVLEQGHQKRPRDQDDTDLLDRKASLMKELSDVVNEKNLLNDKLVYLEDELNRILEERQVLEEIGVDTRKELTSLVKCLSSEREEKISISSEHSELQVKLHEADKHEKTLRRKLDSLRRECEQLREENKHLKAIPTQHAEVVKVQEQVLVASQERFVECSPDAESNLKLEIKKLEEEKQDKAKALESMSKKYDDLAAVCDELENRNNKVTDEKDLMAEEMCALKDKLDSGNQNLYNEIKRKEKQLTVLQTDNEKLLVLKKTLGTQVRHLDREIELLKDRVVCSESEKERIEDANRRQQNEIQELYLHKCNENTVREKLEKLFYENTKQKEQKRMLVTRLQSLERDAKTHILIIRDLEREREELYVRLDSSDSEKRREEAQQQHLIELLDNQEEKARQQIDALSRRVEVLIRENDGMKTKEPQQDSDVDKMKLENRQLQEESTYKDRVMNKLQDENIALKKENSLVRRACDKLRQNRRVVPPERLPVPSHESSPRTSPRLSPRVSYVSGSKTSSFSSFDRVSLASSMISDSTSRVTGQGDTRPRPRSQQTPPSRRASRQREHHEGGDQDSKSISSQECFCSPILSVVNLYPLETQQQQDSSRCAVCKKRKTHKGVIREHYV